MIQVKNSTIHYINERALTFSENDLNDPRRVAVSLVSGTVVMAYVAGTIDYAADGNYERWTLKGYSTKLIYKEAHFVYARLSRTDRTALIVFSVKDYNIDGSITTVTGKDENGNDITETTDPSSDYFYIKIGELTATDGTSSRELTYDSGLLSTKKGDSMTESSNMWELLPGTNPLIKALHWLTDFTVKGFITLVGGLKFSKGKEGDEKIITDVKRSVDSDNEYILNQDGTPVLDELGNPIPNPDYVPVSDETLPSTKYLQKKLDGIDDRYISKVHPDETEHRVKFKDGIEAGEFVAGMAGGTGAQIDRDGRAEMHSLTLREFLEVPELRFNRVDVVSGELWNSIAFGLVESVDTVKRICTLKLEEGERSGLHANDICRGIFSDFGAGTVTEEGEDHNGFQKLYGFSTSYFTPTEILVNEEGRFQFRYNLQEGTTVHPCPSMKFAVYGNFIDTSRQASAYSTRTYKRYINKVNTWKIDPDKHIYAQYGDIEGLTIGGYTMHGYGSFQHNVYLTGAVFQFTPQQKEELKGEDAYSVTLSDYEGIIVIDDEGNVIGGEQMLMNVITDEKNVISEGENVITAAYKLSTQVQAMRGSTPLHHALGIEENAYVVSLNAIGCTAMVLNGVVVVTSVSNPKNCKVEITVNCEGKAVFTQSYHITSVTDGKNPIVADIDNEMEAVACDPDGAVLFGLPLSTTVSMWAGTRQLILDRVEVAAPEGVTVERKYIDQNGKNVDELTEEEAAEITSTRCVVTIPAKATVGGVEVDGITKEAERTLPIRMTAYAWYGGEQYHKVLTFTVNKVIAGENAVIYKLKPSVSSIIKDKSDKLSVEEISCSVVGFDGRKSVELEALPENVRMEYSVDDAELAPYTMGGKVPVVKDNKEFSFALYQKSGEEETQIDFETVPLIRDGIESKNVIAYIRSNDKPAKPAGGSFDNPKPTSVPEWFLEAPDGKEILWGSFRTFVSNDPEGGEWSDPSQMTDTSSVKVVWSSKEKPAALPKAPEFNSDWTDDADADAVWMAIATMSNNVWSDWQVSKVKGADALQLVASTGTISRNSFGTYQPSSVRVRAVRGGKEEAVYFSVWGIHDDPGTGQEAQFFATQSEGKVSYIDITPSVWFSKNFKRIEFLAYESGPSSDYNDKGIAQTVINYIGDGASGPMPRNCGRHSSSGKYYYDDMYRDFVWTTADGGKVFMRDGLGVSSDVAGSENNAVDGSVTGAVPLAAPYWVEVPKTVMTAIDTALIDNANIAGFMFSVGHIDEATGYPVGVLQSQNGKLKLDATDGKLTCIDADIDGNITAGSMRFKTNDDGGSLDGYALGLGGRSFLLPTLSAGENMELKLLFPSGEGATIQDELAITVGSNTNARILVYDDEENASSYRESHVLNSNTLYSVFGYCNPSTSFTTWIIGGSFGSGNPMSVVTDKELSPTSTNPIQNQAVYHALANKIQNARIGDPMDDPDVLYIITE